MRQLVTAAALAVAALAAGCGTGDDQRQARATVERFYDAVRRGDGRTACAQLTSPAREQLQSQTEQGCDDVVTRLSYEGGAIVGVQVYVTNARVELRNGESAFLDRQPEGWRLSAIGCTAAEGKPRDRPFECEVAA